MSLCCKSISATILVSAFLQAAAVAGHPGDEKLPYPIYPEHCRAVMDLINGEGNAYGVVESIDKAIEDTIVAHRGRDIKKIKELFTLQRAAELFSKAKDTDTALLLFNNPEWCSRFLHNLDEDDNLNGALRVIQTLHEFDPDRFAKKYEFCLAYAMVWDQFRGHHWVERYTEMEEGMMLATYKFFLKNERKMLVKPGKLPCELNVYVVGTRLSAAERDWIYKNYRAKGLNAAAIYRSVPWTLNGKVTISHGHKKGLDLPYTLETIKKIGGCCMEQAYFTENVYRLFGVPATYTHGRGNRSGAGHAWAGVLQVQGKKKEWDFEIGRYDSHHYYKGELSDPTNMDKSLTDSEVKILAALLNDAGSVDKIEESYYYFDAALWLDDYRPSPAGDGEDSFDKESLQRELLLKSLKAARFNAKTWRYLSRLASEKKMSEKRADYWLDNAVKYTIGDYPDFTVDLLGGFLGCIENPRKKYTIFKNLYRNLVEHRPDLACDIMVMEGEYWLERNDLRKALNCFIAPLASFSEDKHLLNTVQKRLADIESLIDDKQEVIQAYEMIVNTTRKRSSQSRTMADVLAMARRKLYELYTDAGDLKKAKKYEKYRGE
jgi:hypothetical protein